MRVKNSLQIVKSTCSKTNRTARSRISGEYFLLTLFIDSIFSRFGVSGDLGAVQSARSGRSALNLRCLLSGDPVCHQLGELIVGAGTITRYSHDLRGDDAWVQGERRLAEKVTFRPCTAGDSIHHQYR